MDITLRDRFTELWNRYFPGTELPVTIEFREESKTVKKVPPPDGWRCIICQMGRVRSGTSLVMDARSITCQGGLMYAGYTENRPPEFRYFLSHGRPGGREGERYKQSPELVDTWEKSLVPLSHEGKDLYVTRWDNLKEDDNPEVVIFFARPEVLCGLFSLANFDRSDPDGVICPMGSGCSSILYYPLLEQEKEDPRVVLGMFDPSARPCVPPDVLSMAFPMKKFVRVIGYMDESFLVTKTWETVKKKIGQSAAIYRTG